MEAVPHLFCRSTPYMVCIFRGARRPRRAQIERRVQEAAPYMARIIHTQTVRLPNSQFLIPNS